MKLTTSDILEVIVKVEVFGKHYEITLPSIFDAEEELVEMVEKDIVIEYDKEDEMYHAYVGENIIASGETEEEAEEEAEDQLHDEVIANYEVYDIEYVDNPLNLSINYDGERIEDIDSQVEEINDFDGDIDDVKAVMNCGGYSGSEAIEMINNNQVIIYGGIYSEEQFAEEYVEEIGSWGGVEFERNSTITMYLDYEKIASDLFMGDFSFDEETNRVIDWNY